MSTWNFLNHIGKILGIFMVFLVMSRASLLLYRVYKIKILFCKKELGIVRLHLLLMI